MITNAERDQAESNASPVQMELYATTEAGRKLRDIADRFGITEDADYSAFSITAGDVILKLLSPEELEQTLKNYIPNLDGSSILGLVSAILDYAAPALNETPNNPGTTNPVLQEELQRYRDAATPDTPEPSLTEEDIAQVPTNTDLQSEINELETATGHIGHVRTMEDDMSAAQGEPTYTSSQDALLQKKQTPPQE